jgi:oligoendopeptidase F
MPMAGEEQLQVMHYTRTVGTLRFEYKGTTLDAASLSRHLNDPNEASRREAWDCQNSTWSSVENELDAVFDRLRTIRLDLAQASGFCSYPEYAFHQYGRCDYGPQQCLAYHEAAAIALPPVLKKLRKARSARIGVERLRPWDGIYATTPSDTTQVFSSQEEFLHKTSRMFHRQDDRAAALFDTMVSKGMFDVMARPGKTGGSYHAGMLSSGLPFVCMTATGALLDISCLLHECGHAFHFIATRSHGPLAYSRIPIEFKEFAAISTEWLVAPAMDEFVGPALAAEEKRDRIERALELFAAVAAGDAWQFAAYSPQVTKASQRDELWDHCIERFFGEEAPDPEFRAAESRNWRRQDLFFSRPFYCIEYAIAQMSALELVARSKADPAGTWRRLWDALELGDSRPLPELFQTAGVSLDFSPARLLNVVASLEAEWEQANATIDEAR